MQMVYTVPWKMVARLSSVPSKRSQGLAPSLDRRAWDMVKLSPCIPAKQRRESPHHRPRDVYPALLSWKSHTGQGADFYVPGAVLASTVRLGGGRW